MVTNRQLRAMDDWDQHRAVMAALTGANLHDLIPCRWSVEDCEGCDTAHMLRIVCLEQTGERKMQIGAALDLLVSGHAPRGPTPEPYTAEVLMARRGVEAAV